MTGETIADRETEITIERQERAYGGFRALDVLTFAHRVVGAADFEPTLRREVVRSPGIVAVLPYDRAVGKIVLIRQFRIGAHLATGRGMLVEIVAGAVDPGETADAAAARELFEETGLAARSLRPVARFLPSPGISDEYVSLYLAEVAATVLGERGGHDPSEVTFPFACDVQAAIAAADSGAISNVFTLLALNWFDRHKDLI
ncbi:MAG: NUDIX domain-containing protein [Pararhizobium sp.]